MKSLLRFILIGLFFAAPGEVANQIIVHHTVKGFISTMGIYVVLLAIGYYIGKLFVSAIRNKLASRIVHYLFFGFVGLMIEWFFIGNAPWYNTGANQTGMFTWWGTLFLAPLIFAEPECFNQLKRIVLKFFILFSLLYLIIFVAVPNWDVAHYLGTLVIVYGTLFMNYFFLRYFIALRSRVLGDDLVQAELAKKRTDLMALVIIASVILTVVGNI